jgi:putative methyltransferase (TIGR04325 family)
VGYDHDELGSMYRARIDKAQQSDYAPLFWLKGIVSGATRVFDFGGHVGVSFHGWRRYLEYPPGMQWKVYDVPAIVRAGIDLAAERQSDGLSFTSDLRDGNDCTVLLLAGSLQYVDMTIPELLAAMDGARPRHILLNKMPLYDGESFVTVQSTGRAFHPYRIVNRDELVRSVLALGYRVVDDWQNSEQRCKIPFARGRDIDAYSGYLFERS